MLSIHYVSIMMWIFYIDWQQYWKCDLTMNIGANRNAHGKRTHKEYQQNSHRWQTWQLGFQTLERYWASFQVTRLVHSATNFSTRLISKMKSFFIFLVCVCVWGWGGGGGGGGVLSSNAFTIWCFIPISRPLRVFRRFKRRSCQDDVPFRMICVVLNEFTTRLSMFHECLQ